MEPSTLAREQVVVDHLGEQGMAEPVGIRLAVRIDGQDLRGERLAQSAFDGGLIRASAPAPGARP